MSASIVPRLRPRSVPDATRFTPSTPHTIQFSSAKVSVNRSSNSRFAPSSRPPTGGPTGRGHDPGSGQGRGTAAAAAAAAAAPDLARFTETPDEKVARLRGMHRRAVAAASESRLDRILDRGRVVCDALHRGTLYFLWGLSVVAFGAAGYSAVDMWRHTSKRKAEFFTIQKQLEGESLDAARLAYMTNKATPEQIALIEEVDLIEKRRAEGKPISSLFMPRVPALLSLSDKSEEEKEEDRVRAQLRTVGSMAASHWRGGAGLDQASPEAEAEAAAADAKQDGAAKPGGGLWSWVMGSSDKTSSQSKGAAAAAAAETATVAAAGASESVREKARAAFEKERENQRVGGPLDRIGPDAVAAAPVDAETVEAQATSALAELAGLTEPAAPQGEDKPKKKGWW